jgi:hypothetical protein
VHSGTGRCRESEGNSDRPLGLDFLAQIPAVYEQMEEPAFRRVRWNVTAPAGETSFAVVP